MVGIKCTEIVIELPIGPWTGKSLRVRWQERQISRAAFRRGAFKDSKFAEINGTFFSLGPEIDLAEIGNHLRFVIRIAPIQRPDLGESARPRCALMCELDGRVIVNGCDQVSVAGGQNKLINSCI